jgi:hypothetical protein
MLLDSPVSPAPLCVPYVLCLCVLPLLASSSLLLPPPQPDLQP